MIYRWQLQSSFSPKQNQKKDCVKQHRQADREMKNNKHHSKAQSIQTDTTLQPQYNHYTAVCELYISHAMYIYQFTRQHNRYLKLPPLSLCCQNSSI